MSTPSFRARSHRTRRDNARASCVLAAIAFAALSCVAIDDATAQVTPATYEGLWWASPAGSESGWGLNVAQQADVIFATWFTYDTSGEAWWLSMTGTQASAGEFTGTLYETHGPSFDALPFDPTQVTRTAVGTGTLRFTDAGTGAFDYTVGVVHQTKALTRQVLAPTPTCTFGALADLSQATNYQDLWWAADGGESGWGINLTHEGNIVFGTWFTYDVDGKPLWLSVTATLVVPGTFAGTLFRTSGPPFGATPFDPGKVTRTSVGTATLAFSDGDTGMLTYTITGVRAAPVTQSKAIARQVFRAPGTACSLAPRRIASMSVCLPGAAAAGSCAIGFADTLAAVSAPAAQGGGSINAYGGLTTLADEHSTILSPGTLPGHSDYLFFVASRTNLNPVSSGVVVLSGGRGPDAKGQWTLDFASDYGPFAPDAAAGSRNGQVFESAMQHPRCPTVASAKAQDPTFDLNYADPGSIVLDPTNAANKGPGSLLMIYEGTNRCIGLTGGSNTAAGNNFFSTIGVATSNDAGHSWPSYRFALDAMGAPQYPLPSQDPAQGPLLPNGATGTDVCIGNDCVSPPWPPDHNYGRYAVLGPQVSVAAAMMSSATAGGLTGNVGDSVPSAFVDDVAAGSTRYVYEVHNYVPGPAGLGNPVLPNGQNSDLVIARAALNGGTAPLSFAKWYQGAFAQAGMGGLESPIFPRGSPQNCEGTGQLRTMASLHYVDDTQQYLLTFVCIAPAGDPLTGSPGPGAAWFFATNDDLSKVDQWSAPQEIAGSWAPFDRTVSSCSDWTGWYPSFMSLGRRPGHLTATGYVFHMAGCTDVGGGAGGRQYSSRIFTITTN
jgi:hypothetical protein